MKRAIAVVGPTASGKTSLAIALAQHFASEILSADSMQFYRGMEIGTTAPTPEEQALAKHHFVGFLNPDEDMAAGHYERIARAVAQDLLAAHRIPILAGGSGLYISAFIDGLFDGPARSQTVRDRLRAEAEQQGHAQLMERLRSVDPEYAALITSKNDLVRIVRALEVYELTGRPFSEWHREHQSCKDEWEVLQLALEWDRTLLYERINHRVIALVNNGWVEETETLIASGYEPDLYRLKALGYREMADYLHGKHSLDAAVEAAQQHHRRYAKRQSTWFRADKRIHWIPCSGQETFGDCLEQAISLAEDFMRE